MGVSSAAMHSSNGSRGTSGRRTFSPRRPRVGPVDVMAAGDALGRGFNLVYTRAFLSTMKKKGEEKIERFPGLFDGKAMRRARTLREFDNVVTAPLHGFRDTDDYWTAPERESRCSDASRCLIFALERP